LAKEQVCRSWEGAQTDRQPKLGSGNIPHHRCPAQVINGVDWESRNSFFQEFDIFFREFDLFCKFGKNPQNA